MNRDRAISTSPEFVTKAYTKNELTAEVVSIKQEFTEKNWTLPKSSSATNKKDYATILCNTRRENSKNEYELGDGWNEKDERSAEQSRW